MFVFVLFVGGEGDFLGCFFVFGEVADLEFFFWGGEGGLRIAEFIAEFPAMERDGIKANLHPTYWCGGQVVVEQDR